MADLNALLSAEFGAGYQDLRATLPHNPNGPGGDFSLRPLLGLDILAVHHTVGPRDQSWKAIAQTHIRDRGFAGIGYHIGIRQGAVAYLGDVSQARACCRDMNHRVLCVTLTGNYETMPLDAADAKALGRVAAVVQGWAQSSIGRKLKVLGHKEVPGQATACPGRNLLVEVHRIATLPDPGTPTGPDAPRLLAESAARQTLPLNRQAALLKRIIADGFLPTSPEFPFDSFIAQRAERLNDGKVRVYYVKAGDFGNVKFVER
ncbi:MAG: N-acetylmuramoyl-L-alanine amidase [Ardenticatenia bacterium]|nr:N-acetylmuramoyl-L-alanine amidase [Ardenticatenia bacterium]